MKHVSVLVPLALLAACDSSPEVDIRDANASEVGEAVAESGVTGDAFQVRPGKWESKVAIEEMQIPGMPAAMQEQMKQTFAERQQTGFTSCLTPEEAKKPKADFFAGQDNNCRYDHFRMGDGKIDAKMRCDAGEAVQSMEMAGTYSPESYSMTMTTVRTGEPGPGGEVRMKMRMDAKRVGDCDSEAASQG